MACPDFVSSAAGRQGLGVVQPQSGLDYPLVGPSVFTEYDYAHGIRYLVADFYFEYDDPAEYTAGTKATHPLRIKYLYGVGCVENTPPLDFPTPVHDADIVLVDALGAVVFNTTAPLTTFTSHDWGTDYKIYTWKQASALCRLVAYTTWPTTDIERQQYHKYLVPDAATLDERAVYKMPRRLRTIRVRNGDNITGKYAGPVILMNGYNTEISPAAPAVINFRDDTFVTFTAVAGSGAGQYDDCAANADNQPITHINGIGADNFGNFLLSSSDCLWARQPTTYPLLNTTTPTPEPATLQLGADCVPCCGCADYATAAKYMNDTSLRYALIGARSDNVRAHHDDNVSRWNAQQTCSLLSPLKLIFVPQRCPYIDVIAMLCNSCQTCIGDTTLKLVISSDQPSVIVALECGYTALFAKNLNGSSVGITELTAEPGDTFGPDAPVLLFANITDFPVIGEQGQHYRSVDTDMVYQWLVNAYEPVLSFANRAAFPLLGATGYQYQAADTHMVYRWVGNVYVATDMSIAAYTFVLPPIDANDSAYVKLRLKFMDAGDPPLKAHGPYPITGTLTAVINGTGNSPGTPLIPGCGDPEITDPASVETTQTLYCNDQGVTEAPC